MASRADDRRRQALELHLAGATYDEIARQCGYASRSGAYKAVQDALKAQPAPKVDEAATTELARLDAMLTGLWPKARRGDVAAIDRVMKIDERKQQILRQQALVEPPAEKPRTPLDEVSARREAKAKGPAGAARRRV